MVERDLRAQDAAERALDRIEEPVRRLLSRGVDVIVQAGIPLVTRNGWGYEEAVQARVKRVTEVPLALDIRCSIASMQALSLSRIALLAGFQEEQLKDIAAYLGHAAIEVVAMASIRDRERR